MVNQSECVPREEFLQKIVIPFYYGNRYKDLNIIVLDMDTNIIFASESYAKYWGFETTDDIYGMTLKEKTTKSEASKKIANTLFTMHHRVMQKQTVVQYVLFLNKNSVNNPPHIYLHFPIFYYDGSVIGTAIRSKKFYIVTKGHLFGDTGYGNDPEINHDQIILTSRQKEVLFLLISGFSQDQIALQLSLSRGTISSCITGLCKKFGISGQNTEVLITRAGKLGFNSDIPESLVTEEVVIINEI